MRDDLFNRQSFVDIIYGAIKEDILSRKFTIGQKLIVRELSEVYKTSQTPITQALHRLISEGLVENIPRRGMFVKSVTLENIIEVLDSRLMIELYCVPKIIEAARKDKGFIKETSRILEHHKKILKEKSSVGRYMEIVAKERTFHEHLVGSSKNSIIISTYENLNSHLYIIYTSGIKTEKRLFDAFSEHSLIFKALKELDETKLCETIRSHNFNTKKDYEEIFTKKD